MKITDPSRETSQKKDLTLESINENIERSFKAITVLALVLPLILLAILLFDAFMTGRSRLTLDFITSFPSRFPEKAGILSALVGTGYLIGLVAVIAIPISVGAAIYLEEYAKKNWLTSFIEINISNLAGVPSVIYGLLGLGLFVHLMNMGRSLLVGAITLALMLLPMIIMATREALRAVPHHLREGAYALGAEKWRTIRKVVLPLALPGILTGIILSMARAIGETAPLITIGALTYIAFLPDSVNSPFTALPIQIFNWISRPQKGFHIDAAAGIVVLLLILLLMNSLAIWLRIRLQKRVNW